MSVAKAPVIVWNQNTVGATWTQHGALVAYVWSTDGHDGKRVGEHAYRWHVGRGTWSNAGVQTWPAKLAFVAAGECQGWDDARDAAAEAMRKAMP